MLYSHHSKVPADMWPCKWFTPAEIACKGDGSIMIDTEALIKLDALRTAIGKPIIITSGYRSPKHNEAVGGSPNSKHKLGKAFDISLAGHDKEELYAAAKTVGFTGFGKYKTFMHVDTAKPREWGSW